MTILQFFPVDIFVQKLSDTSLSPSISNHMSYDEDNIWRKYLAHARNQAGFEHYIAC